MRIKDIIVILILVAGFTNCAQIKINGDGNLTTKEIKVSDFHEIKLYGNSLEFNYEQKKDTSPYMQITIDNNLFDLLDIRSEGKTLIIEPKNKNEQLLPTRFLVKANSTDLTKIKKAGDGNFSVNSPLTTSTLEIDIAGSVLVHLKDTATVNEIKLDMAGSGTFQALHLHIHTLRCKTAGSNKIYLGGQANKSSFHMAGLGNIKALAFTSKYLSCQIAGNGDIKATVIDKIDLKVAGNLTITYKGNPTINKKIAGNYRAIQVEE